MIRRLAEVGLVRKKWDCERTDNSRQEYKEMQRKARKEVNGAYE